MVIGKGIRILGAVSVFIFSWMYCRGEELPATNEVKRPAFGTTRNLLSSFQIKMGFRIELAAPEGMVSSPVAMAFDENGRLFVAEMRDYPEGRTQTPHLGRVRLLENTDGDGVFDSSTVYADNLAWPSAIACYDGGIFVGATPEIIYLKGEERKVVFTGFGIPPNAPDPEALLNSFVWSIDDRIYGGSAGIGGTITSLGASGTAPLTLADNDFSIEPRTLTIRAETGKAQTGLTFDSHARKYVSDLTHPLQDIRIPARYVARNPFVLMPPELVDVVGPAPKIFRFAVEQPLIAGATGPPGTVATQSNKIVSAWMSKARGSLIYRGNAFPSNYVGNVFIADPVAHVVHHSLLVESGVGVVAQRPSDEQNSEFLMARDASFHPTQLVSGPDGALYIADMQAGGESGRILRVVPVNFKRTKAPHLKEAKVFDLVALLGHPNSWHSDTAARLLYERRDMTAIPLLTNVLNNSRVPQAKLNALRALEGIGALNEAVLMKGFRDRDELVREQAVALCESFVERGKLSDKAWTQLEGLASDPSVRVRYQLALTLGAFGRPERLKPLSQILERDVTNLWFQAAVASSLNKGTPDLLIGLAAMPRWRNDPAGLSFIGKLGLVIGMKGQIEEVNQVLDFINRTALGPLASYTLLSALGEGLQRIGSSLALVDPQGRMQRFIDRALQLATDSSVAEPLRLIVLRFLGFTPQSTSNPWDVLQLLLGTGESVAIQTATVDTLSRYDDPTMGANLISRWPDLSQVVKGEIITALLSRTDRVVEVIGGLETGRIKPSELSPAQVEFLRNYTDPVISRRALRIFGPTTRARPLILEQFKDSLRPPGDAIRGRNIFRAPRAECHRLGGEGRRLGPRLVTAKLSGKPKVRSAILERNREIRAIMQLQFYQRGGKIFSGLLPIKTRPL